MSSYEEKQKKKAIETFDRCIAEEQGIIDCKLESLKLSLKEGGKREYGIALCDSISHHYAIITGLEIAKSKL